jgi:hypothetical protein
MEQIRSGLRESTPAYMIPSAIVLLDRLPLTATGKVDRRALPAPDMSAYTRSDYEAPRGEVEQTLAELWRDLLGVDRVGRDDNFFELGGHSLLAMRLVGRICERTGARVPALACFRHPTVRLLARALDAERSMPPSRDSARPFFEEGTV